VGVGEGLKAQSAWIAKVAREVVIPVDRHSKPIDHECVIYSPCALAMLEIHYILLAVKATG